MFPPNQKKLLGVFPAQSSRVSSLQLLERPVSTPNTTNLTFFVGAGKTTLLNYLSGREISKGLTKTGKILING